MANMAIVMALEWSRRGLIAALFSTAALTPELAEAAAKKKKTPAAAKGKASSRKKSGASRSTRLANRRSRRGKANRVKKRIVLPELFPAVMIAEASSNAELGFVPILQQGDAEALKPPMSLTKYMMLDLVLEALDDGKINLTDMVTFGPQTSSVEPMHCGFRSGDEIPMADMIALMVRNSCNQCAEQLAITLFGSRAAAVQALNERARDSGLDDTVFVSPSGLPSGGRGQTTATDMTSMAVDVDSDWSKNPAYQLITNKDGYYVSETTQAIFAKRRYPAASMMKDGRLLLTSSGDAALPAHCTSLKTGTWGNGADQHKNIIFKFEMPMIMGDNKVFYGCVLDCRKHDLLPKISALVEKAQSALSLKNALDFFRPSGPS